MRLLQKTWLVSIFFFFFLFSLNTNAAIEKEELENLLIEVKQKKLWQDPAWLNLVHYQPESNDTSFLSQVDDPKFFNAQDGKFNPANELQETIRSFYNEDIAKLNEHAQCRFVARLSWLKKQVQINNLPIINCQEYNDWRKEIPAENISLIFPAYHLNSPSSMFGHTLLRIDGKDHDASTSWLSSAVNFGANISDEDNSLAFAFKGLGGGYVGTFVVAPYYTKIKEYNRAENRDIWEYALNFTPEETNKIVLHLWELKGIKFDYYFFDENCSYRLLELLQVARPKLKLTDQFGLTAIPIDTVRSIDEANLITGIKYRPSQATNVNYLLSLLNSEQKKLVFNISKNAKYIEIDTYQTLTKEKQQIVLDAAYLYLRYQQNENGHTKENAKTSFKLLKEINKTPDFTSKKAGFSEFQQPERGHLSKRMVISTGQDNEVDFAQFGFRMSYHSLEDQLSGFLQGAQINVVNIDGRISDDEIYLERLDMIDIFSLTPRNQFFQPLSWKVYTGLEQQVINGKNHLTGHVTAGAGASYTMWSDNIIYGLLTARLESNSQFKYALEPALGISTGLLQHFSFGTAHLEVSGEEFYDTEYRHRVEFTQNITLKRNHALQLSARRQRQTNLYFTEVELGYHYFFH